MALNANYSHVVVVGIDGAGQYIKNADTPYFDRIFRDGSVTYRAYASNPSISAECWGSMLTGVGPRVHGLTNEIVSTRPYPLDSRFPSLFKRIHKAYPDYILGSYCDWNPITFGIVENDLPVSQATARDTELTPVICDYIRENKPNFLFIQMDSVDGAGHGHGYGSKAHLERIHVVDAYINDIYQAVCDADMKEDTLFIVIADHGGTYSGEDQPAGHGGWSEGEKLVTFALAGKNVIKGEMGDANVRDLASIVLYALGIEAPAFDENGWTSQIPENLFTDKNIPAYRDISSETGAEPRVSRIPHTSEKL